MSALDESRDDLSALPLELLDHRPSPELHAIAARRAAIAWFRLEPLDASG